MNESSQSNASTGSPFPVDWIYSRPREVENLLSSMSVQEQAQEILSMPLRCKVDALTLCERAEEVIQLLPEEEVYQMVKEKGESDSLAVLAIATPDQLQFMFDVEWWQGDKFKPDRAMEWVEILDQAEESKFMEWILTEEFEQKVMLMQSLIKVYKQDEMTDSYEGVEGLDHFSPDGVYDIFFKTEDYSAIKKAILRLREAEEGVYFSLMEAVIWYPVTQTVERAYHWRQVRSSAHGIPEFEEAIQVYSALKPEALREPAPDASHFERSDAYLPPAYPLIDGGDHSFYKQCLGVMKAGSRFDAIRWEMVYLGNKVMVADQLDASDAESRKKVLQKVMGYVNIGLQLGAEGDPEKGARILEKTWLQPLFQVGYERLFQLKAKAQQLISERGKALEYLMPPVDKERIAALMGRFPQIWSLETVDTAIDWRDFQDLEEVVAMEDFLDRQRFHARLASTVLSLNEIGLEQLTQDSTFPESKDAMNIVCIVSTALAGHILYQGVQCEPLADSAARSFLKMFFLPNVYQGDAKEPNPDLIASFKEALQNQPMAWVDSDKRYLDELLDFCVAQLKEQFGQLNPNAAIDWKYTQGLCLKL
ncbi:MAG: hypothetical protein G3M78_04820 [Candidatus Nitrohelix vancouverensis]|uniref:Uncharacterized protein n=1 Tax=Candidatus Nitrohelix vancouverensis TaxID=2705534 RepID=A0A7T0C1D3_9BACT|nr:MAG: hypothetical protein G3M78_04820 [Candidatus Nitrohelix vancouverensis]